MKQEKQRKRLVGRGSQLESTGRFESVKLVQLEAEDAEAKRKVPTQFFDDDSQSIVSSNSSPDLFFNLSLNPYRGCVHGCSYCYARPTHEYLGWGPGLDFESKIVVKRNAGALFRKWLARRKVSEIEPVMISGVTDCYQPPEKQFEVTRDCLRAALEFRHPVHLITKNSLIMRDIDLLKQLADLNLVAATISITSLEQSLIRIMEPRTSSPQSRLETVAALSDVGVPVFVFVAPVIPAINDDEIPEILKQAKAHGAAGAGYIVLRLPITVKEVFDDWLQVHFADRREKVLGRIESLRGGKLNSSVFGERMRGTGVWADQFRTLFKTFANKHGLDTTRPKLRTDLFQIVDATGRTQQTMF